MRALCDRMAAGVDRAAESEIRAQRVTTDEVKHASTSKSTTLLRGRKPRIVFATPVTLSSSEESPRVGVCTLSSSVLVHVNTPW